MGTQGFVVAVGIAIALAIGAAASVLDVGARGVATIATAMVPVMWMLLHMTERIIGREIWQYTAPYPYRSMEVPIVSARLQTAPQSGIPNEDSGDVRLAA